MSVRKIKVKNSKRNAKFLVNVTSHEEKVKQDANPSIKAGYMSVKPGQIAHFTIKSKEEIHYVSVQSIDGELLCNNWATNSLRLKIFSDGSVDDYDSGRVIQRKMRETKRRRARSFSFEGERTPPPYAAEPIQGAPPLARAQSSRKAERRSRHKDRPREGPSTPIAIPKILFRAKSSPDIMPGEWDEKSSLGSNVSNGKGSLGSFNSVSASSFSERDFQVASDSDGPELIYLDNETRQPLRTVPPPGQLAGAYSHPLYTAHRGPGFQQQAVAGAPVAASHRVAPPVLPKKQREGFTVFTDVPPVPGRRSSRGTRSPAGHALLDQMMSNMRVSSPRLEIVEDRDMSTVKRRSSRRKKKGSPAIDQSVRAKVPIVQAVDVGSKGRVLAIERKSSSGRSLEELVAGESLGTDRYYGYTRSPRSRSSSFQ